MTDRGPHQELARPADSEVTTTTSPKLGLAVIARRGAGAVAGTGLLALGVLGCMAGIREIIGKGALSRGGPVAMVLFAAAGIAGVTLLRWGIGRRTLTAEHGPAREPAPAALLAVISQRLLAIASAYGGRVTAAEVAAALAIEQRPAQRVLDEAVTTGAARLLFSPDGIPVYEFPGLVARKRDAKEPWAL